MRAKSVCVAENLFDIHLLPHFAKHAFAFVQLLVFELQFELPDFLALRFELLLVVRFEFGECLLVFLQFALYGVNVLQFFVFDFAAHVVDACVLSVRFAFRVDAIAVCALFDLQQYKVVYASAVRTARVFVVFLNAHFAHPRAALLAGVFDVLIDFLKQTVELELYIVVRLTVWLTVRLVVWLTLWQLQDVWRSTAQVVESVLQLQTELSDVAKIE